MIDMVMDWLLARAERIKHKKAVGAALVGIPMAAYFGLGIIEYGIVTAILSAIGAFTVVVMVVGGIILLVTADNQRSRIS